MRKAWTYSHLDGFNTCPRQFYHKNVLRDVVDPPTIHTQWGKEVHSAFEVSVLDGSKLPETMKQWQPISDKLHAAPGEKLLEYKFALDRNMEPADWSNAWSRGIGDGVIINGSNALAWDYKTGKRKVTDQLVLYGIYVFAHFPEVKKVKTSFVWLKDKAFDNAVYTRADLPDMWGKLMPRIVRLEKAYDSDKWPAKPSGLCNGWCSVKTCEFNGTRSR